MSGSSGASSITSGFPGLGSGMNNSGFHSLAGGGGGSSPALSAAGQPWEGATAKPTWFKGWSAPWEPQGVTLPPLRPGVTGEAFGPQPIPQAEHIRYAPSPPPVTQMMATPSFQTQFPQLAMAAK